MLNCLLNIFYFMPKVCQVNLKIDVFPDRVFCKISQINLISLLESNSIAIIMGEYAVNTGEILIIHNPKKHQNYDNICLVTSEGLEFN